MVQKRKTNSTTIPKIQTPRQFIDQYAKMQMELMNGMLECITKGEIKIQQINEKDADSLIEDIIGNWESKDEPDLDSHLEMSGAIFLWALLDQVYGESLEPDEDSDSDSNATYPKTDKRIELAFDVLKTVRAIWGRPANQ